MKKEISKTILRAIKNAFNNFQKNFARGLSTDQLFCFFKSSLDNELGEYQIVYDYIWGKDSVNIDGITSGYIPQDGDTVIMDISVCYKGYWCDVCRTYFVGAFTKEQKECFELIKKSISAGEKLLRVNQEVKDIFGAVNQVYKNAGLSLVHHAGHKIADKPISKPQFLEEEAGVIEDDNLYAIESGLYNGFGIRLENDYYIENDLTENLFIDLMPLEISEYLLK